MGAPHWCIIIYPCFVPFLQPDIIRSTVWNHENMPVEKWDGRVDTATLLSSLLLANLSTGLCHAGNSFIYQSTPSPTFRSMRGIRLEHDVCLSLRRSSRCRMHKPSTRLFLMSLTRNMTAHHIWSLRDLLRSHGRWIQTIIRRISIVCLSSRFWVKAKRRDKSGVAGVAYQKLANNNIPKWTTVTKPFQITSWCASDLR